MGVNVAKQLFVDTGLIPAAKLDELSELDWTPRKKYVRFLAEAYLNGDDVQFYTLPLLRDFDNHLQVLPPELRNIDAVKNSYELAKVLLSIPESNKKKHKKAIMDGVKCIFENSRWKIYWLKTHSAAAALRGWTIPELNIPMGPDWCVGEPNNNSYFKRYSGGKALLYLFDKTRSNYPMYAMIVADAPYDTYYTPTVRNKKPTKWKDGKKRIHLNVWNHRNRCLYDDFYPKRPVDLVDAKPKIGQEVNPNAPQVEEPIAEEQTCSNLTSRFFAEVPLDEIDFGQCFLSEKDKKTLLNNVVKRETVLAAVLKASDETGPGRYRINEDGTIDVIGNIVFDTDFMDDFVNIREVNEEDDSYTIESPDFENLRLRYVVGDFVARDFTLEGYMDPLLPKKVKGNFRMNCVGGHFLTSLNGFPDYVGGDFSIRRTYRCLNSLKGGPKYVGGDYEINVTGIETLEGMAKVVCGNIDVSENRLTSLKGLPKTFGDKMRPKMPEVEWPSFTGKDPGVVVTDKEDDYASVPSKTSDWERENSGVRWTELNISENALKSLEHCPTNLPLFRFNAQSNRLTSLKGCPKDVIHFAVGENKLVTLEGAPKRVLGDFYCSANRLKSLKGGPSKVSGGFIASANDLKSLKGAPTFVGGVLDLQGNPSLRINKDNLHLLPQVEGEMMFDGETFSNKPPNKEKLRNRRSMESWGNAVRRKHSPPLPPLRGAVRGQAVEEILDVANERAVADLIAAGDAELAQQIGLIRDEVGNDGVVVHMPDNEDPPIGEEHGA